MEPGDGFELAEAALDAILDEDEAARQDLALAEAIGVGEFYHEHATKLVGFVIKLGATVQDAEDIVHGVLLKLLNRWDTVENPTAWARTVATHAYMRSAVRVREVVTTEPIPESTAAPALFTPEFRAEIAEEFAEVTAALAVLPGQQRLVMAWRMEGSYTDKEIAQVLRTTPKAVAAAAKRARRTLKTHLRREDRR
ncbi:RNA polymerase sigma factor [Amycolatopsis sp. Hca4]|uniref:RNA polymerase sigma factor n=1 Tax=Amycolatopsis sp. Hca4 TaxID=2742131 RepID=UPI001591347E|nr:RNA polymerase sigma factor [Amycolatopsis sp. Hca4]QKV74126.1 RNA polymerase sigma factor [Amycolatopsis sp. Hca4]